MQLSKKQMLVATSFLNPEKFQLFDGAVRTGKTHMGINAFADGTLQYLSKPTGNDLHDNQHGVLGKTFRNIKENLEPYLLQQYRMHGIYPAVTQFGLMMQVNNKIIKLLYFGASNAGSVASVQGQTLRSLFGDEAPVLHRDTLDMAISRTITYSDAKIYLTSNPEGSEEHWYYQDFILSPYSRVIHLTMYDNPILSPKDIEEIASTFTEDMYKRKVLGLWVISQGAVYPVMPMFIRDVQVPNKFDFITIGLDEGRKDATTAVAWGYVKKTKHWYAFDQYYNKKTNSNINTVADELIEWLKTIRKRYSGIQIHFWCETNPGTIKNLLQVHTGLPKRVAIRYVQKKRDADVLLKSQSAVQQRIDLVNLMIGSKKMFVADSCSHLKKALATAMYDKNGKRLDDGSSDIDSLDAMEYGIKRYTKRILGEIYENWRLT